MSPSAKTRTRTFLPEILGLNLAWQFLDLAAFGPELIRDACAAYALPRLGDDLGDPDHLQKGRDMAREAVVRFLEDAGEANLGDGWLRVLRGVAAGVAMWTGWFEGARTAAPAGAADPRQEMIALLWRKAPHASGYHAEKRLGARKIDEYLDPKKFDGPAMLEALAGSPWVRTGKSGKSVLLSRLIAFGGPMLAVFSPVEQQIIQNWIDSLPPREAQSSAPAAKARPDAGAAPTGPSIREQQYVEGRGWKAGEFRERSRRLYGKCTIRELYHYLINVEFYPDILPVAERRPRSAGAIRGDAVDGRASHPVTPLRSCRARAMGVQEASRAGGLLPSPGRTAGGAQGGVHRGHRSTRPLDSHRRRVAPGNGVPGPHPHHGRKDALPRARGRARRGQAEGAPCQRLTRKG